MIIKAEQKIDELIKFNREMGVEVYYLEFCKTDEKGMNYFNGNTEEFEIFINNALKAYEEMKALAHETGHIMADCSTCLSRPFIVESGERRAENWACRYIVRYEDLVRTLRNWRIASDYEAAQEIGVDLDTLRRAARRYELEGRPVRQWQFIECD